jgi:SsrA-binding protein
MSNQIINRKAKFDYEFIRTEIAGIQLVGSEIKSIREGMVNLGDAFCFFVGDELFLKNTAIKENGTSFCHEEMRDRKLLMKKKELLKIQKDLVKGMTLVPYRIFINERGLAKVEIALARGKKSYDKRQTIKSREAEIEIKRNIK